MGSIEQNIVNQALRFGQEIPEKIRNKPRLLFGLDLYLNAYFDLRPEAKDGIIPWSSSIEYAKFYEFDFEDTETMIYMMHEMSSAYNIYLSKKGN